jgi:hypothetical protein
MVAPAFLPIGEHLERDDAADVLARYFHEPDRPEQGTAGRFFERLADPRSPHAVTAADVLAVAALDEHVPPHAAWTILQDGMLAARLADIPTTVTIMDREAAALLDGPCTELWERLRAIPGVGPVAASKLLAAKRPHLVPIYDERVRAVLRPPAGGFWSSMRHTLTDGSLAVRAGAVRAAAAAEEPSVPEGLSVLRVIDIVVRGAVPDRVELARVSDEGFD